MICILRPESLTWINIYTSITNVQSKLCNFNWTSFRNKSKASSRTHTWYHKQYSRLHTLYIVFIIKLGHSYVCIELNAGKFGKPSYLGVRHISMKWRIYKYFNDADRNLFARYSCARRLVKIKCINISRRQKKTSHNRLNCKKVCIAIRRKQEITKSVSPMSCCLNYLF